MAAMMRTGINSDHEQTVRTLTTTTFFYFRTRLYPDAAAGTDHRGRTEGIRGGGAMLKWPSDIWMAGQP